jgi:ribonuclease Z
MTNWHAAVLTPPSADTGPALAVVFDNAKYVFNVGENTGRAVIHSGLRLARTRALFLTGLAPERVGGLPGAFCFFVWGLSRTNGS